MEVKSYKDLQYWKLGMELVVMIYKFTEKFPKSETFGLTSQIRRASVSIPANIAEGYRRGSRKEYRVFLSYSFGSGAEVETYLDLCLQLNYITHDEYKLTVAKLEQIMKMLNVTIRKLSTPYSSLTTP
jgi:four helix bundle protein